MKTVHAPPGRRRARRAAAAEHAAGPAYPGDKPCTTTNCTAEPPELGPFTDPCQIDAEVSSSAHQTPTDEIGGVF